MTSIFEKRVSFCSFMFGEEEKVHNIDSYFLTKIKIDNFPERLGHFVFTSVQVSITYIWSWRLLFYFAVCVHAMFRLCPITV